MQYLISTGRHRLSDDKSRRVVQETGLEVHSRLVIIECSIGILAQQPSTLLTGLFSRASVVLNAKGTPVSS